MFHYEYKTSGTCASLISFDIDGGKTHEVENNTFRLKQLDMGAYLGASYRF